MQYRFAVAALIAVLSVATPAFADDEDVRSTPSKPKAAATKAKPAAKKPQGKQVDVNTASRDELKTLPGIAESDVDKIIAGRPYLSKAHLLTHGVLSEAQYYTVKTRIKASQKTGDPAQNLKAAPSK